MTDPNKAYIKKFINECLSLTHNERDSFWNEYKYRKKELSNEDYIFFLRKRLKECDETIINSSHHLRLWDFTDKLILSSNNCQIIQNHMLSVSDQDAEKKISLYKKHQNLQKFVIRCKLNLTEKDTQYFVDLFANCSIKPFLKEQLANFNGKKNLSGFQKLLSIEEIKILDNQSVKWIDPDLMEKFKQIEKVLFKRGYIDSGHKWVLEKGKFIGKGKGRYKEKGKSRLIDFGRVLINDNYFLKVIDHEKKKELHYWQFISERYGFGETGVSKLRKKYTTNLDESYKRFSWVLDLKQDDIKK